MKKNFLIAALGIISLAAGAIALASCSETNSDGGDDFNDDDVIWFTCTHVDAVEATCQSEGNIECWYCEVLDLYLTDDMSMYGTTSLDGFNPDDYGEHFTKDEIVTSKTPHDYGSDGVCKMCGEKGSYTPSDGLGYKLSEDGTYYSVSSIGNCTDEVVVIPSTYNNLPVLKIGDHALNECTMRAVIIPEGITGIGQSAFIDCYNLESVFLPDSLTYVGPYAFDYDYKLGVYESRLLYVDNWIVDGRSNYDTGKSVTPTVIRDGTAGIGVQSAMYATGRLTLPDSVKYINEDAFYYSDIVAITLNDNIERIEDKTFRQCSNLMSVTLGKNVKYVGEEAFYQCFNLFQITLPDGVTEISDRAFYECWDLLTVTMSDNVTTIGAEAFYDCSNLVTVTLPESLTKIGADAFRDCDSLLVVEFKNPEGWTTDGEAIASSALSDPSSAAALLTTNRSEWTREN